MERLERADAIPEPHRLELGKCPDLRALSIPKHPGERCVVVENALERVDNLIIERRLGLLRQSANINAHGIHRVELADAVLRENVHHARSKPAVGNDRDVLPPCFGIDHRE